MNLQQLKSKLLKQNQSDYCRRRADYISLQVTAFQYAYGIGVDEWAVRLDAAKKYESVAKPW